MANPKQFVRNKSQRVYLMNWSTWLKERPFYLKTKLKPSMPLSLETATRWCWVFVPSVAPWTVPLAWLCKRHSKEWSSLTAITNAEVPNEKVSMCTQYCAAWTSTAISVTNRCPSAMGDWHPTTSVFPRSWQEQMVILLLAGYQIPALQGPHLMQWLPGRRQRRVRFPLAPVSYKLSADLW